MTRSAARAAGAGAARASASAPSWPAKVAVLGVLLLAAPHLLPWLEATAWSTAVGELGFERQDRSSRRLHFPLAGPYDTRLGYTRLSRWQSRLESHGFDLRSQVRFSPGLLQWTGLGLPPVYEEKTRAGLRILDRHGEALYESAYPGRVFTDFAAIPSAVLNTLLFIENRELFAQGSPFRNPVIEWDRLAYAALSNLLPLGRRQAPGGSTLAIQIEKYRHSPDGITRSPLEKLRQVASATARSYQYGPETRRARERIALEYVNTVPLAALSGYGEVRGLGDGLHAWYGADLVEVARALRDSEVPLAARALAYRRVLSLFLAQRRPSYYLLRDPEALARLTDRYLRLLARAGQIGSELRDAALAVRTTPRRSYPGVPSTYFARRKAVDATRYALLGLLDEPRMYALDRFDLEVEATLDRAVNDRVQRLLESLGDGERAASLGLRERRLLGEAPADQVTYAFALFERTARGNLLRVQADTLDRPFNVNEGLKLDLGSTAKLRTLVSYLEIVASLYERYSERPPEELKRVAAHRSATLQRWVLGRLSQQPGMSLAELLDDALARRVSAAPGRGFFTGGGLHRFSNFDPADNGRVLTVSEAFHRSVNLPFVRLMREVVYHVLFGPAGRAHDVLDNRDDPQRDRYLMRFVDWEAERLLRDYHARHASSEPDQRIDGLVAQGRRSLRRLAAIYRSARPSQPFAAFEAFVRRHRPTAQFSERSLTRAFEASDPEKRRLSDRGYLARMHPLELWAVEYLESSPEADLDELVLASEPVRRESYRWLWRTRHKRIQDRRILVMLEREAFVEIHRQWKATGYPFDSLVASLATGIGSSSDRPAALAELIGILGNDGVRLPLVRVDALRFALDTPYESHLEREEPEGERVLRSEVARAVRRALVGVVDAGTAGRARDLFRAADGTPIPVGGKTGTGDNRHKRFDRRGRLIEARPLSRTATFAFLIGDRFFGVVTAYVEGEVSGDHGFTSSLPVHVLRLLAPEIDSLVTASEPSSPRS